MPEPCLKHHWGGGGDVKYLYIMLSMCIFLAINQKTVQCRCYLSMGSGALSKPKGQIGNWAWP